MNTTDSQLRSLRSLAELYIYLKSQLNTTESQLRSLRSLAELYIYYIKACYISGEKDNESVKKDVVKGRYQILYFTPEMILSNRRWREIAYRRHLHPPT